MSLGSVCVHKFCVSYATVVPRLHHSLEKNPNMLVSLSIGSQVIYSSQKPELQSLQAQKMLYNLHEMIWQCKENFPEIAAQIPVSLIIFSEHLTWVRTAGTDDTWAGQPKTLKLCTKLEINTWGKTNCKYRSASPLEGAAVVLKY